MRGSEDWLILGAEFWIIVLGVIKTVRWSPSAERVNHANVLMYYIIWLVESNCHKFFRLLFW